MEEEWWSFVLKGVKLLSEIKSIYILIFQLVSVKGGESEQFRIESREWGETGVYHVPFAVQCIYGCSDEGGE